MGFSDDLPESLGPVGFEAWAQGMSARADGFAVVAQAAGQALPARPDATVVHWYSWDEPPLSSENPYDQWFEILEPVAPAVPDAFTVGQWSVADTGAGGQIAITISELPDANPSISDLEYRIGTGTAVSLSATTTGTYNVSGLTNDVEVNVQVRAVNSEGAGDWSDIKAVTPTEVTEAVPEAFTVGQWSVADTEAGGTVAVTISELPLANPSITDIEYRIDAGTAVSFSESTTGTYNISGLTDDVEVDVQIRALNSEGAGDWSDVKAVTPTEAEAATTFSTDFSEYTAGVAPSDWDILQNQDDVFSAEVVAAGSIGANLLRLLNNTASGRYALAAPAAWSADNDQEVLAKVRFEIISGTANPVRIKLRASANNEDSYFAELSSSSGGSLLVRKYTGGNVSTIGTDTTQDPLQNTYYWIRFRAEGTALKAKMWADGGSEPGWQVEETDTDHSSGRLGVGSFSQVEMDVDYFAAALGGATAPGPA